MTFELPVSDNDATPLTMRGKAGQMSSVSLAGVLGVQTSRRLADPGDVVILKQGFSVVDTLNQRLPFYLHFDKQIRIEIKYF
jgi:hypothetical protein